MREEKFRTVLQFSGGADSCACLFLKRDEWNDITVMWLNTGSADPSTRAQMMKVRDLVPHFQVVNSDKAAWEREHGIAVDTVPMRSTVWGHTFHATKGPTFAPHFLCCRDNIWLPLDRAVRALGATKVIRGQRNEESRKAPVRSGDVVDGIAYEFPIQDWTHERVMEYCRRECPELLPSSYDEGEQTSRDCWDCIAYLDHNARRIANLEAPRRAVMKKRLAQYRKALTPDLEALAQVIGASSSRR